MSLKETIYQADTSDKEQLNVVPLVFGYLAMGAEKYVGQTRSRDKMVRGRLYFLSFSRVNEAYFF